MSYELAKPRKAKCSNCGELMEFSSSAEKVKCEGCSFTSSFRADRVIGKIVKGSNTSVAQGNLLGRRVFAAENMTNWQKAFVAVQVFGCLSTLSLTHDWFVKVSIRLCAAFFGIDGQAHKLGKYTIVAVPVLLTLLSWIYTRVLHQPVEPGIISSIWNPSAPAWPGLGSYVTPLLVNIAYYVACSKIYTWLWYNSVGTAVEGAPQLLKKVLLMFVLPYYVLPHVVPALAAMAIKKVVF